AVRRRFQAAGIACDAEWFEINEAMWGLVARRLAWISVYETSSPQWVLNLTERGSVIAEDQEVSADDPTRYLERLVSDAPQTTEIVKHYLTEALKSFVAECYLASAVM